MSILQPTGSELAPSRWTRMGAPLLTGGALTAAVVTLQLRDPHASGSYASCPLLYLTGFACPGCGGLRAVHDLTHGDVSAALSSNLVVVGLMLPLVVVLWLTWTRARWRARPLTSPLLTSPVAWAVLAVLLVFGLVRNLPAGSWLAP